MLRISPNEVSLNDLEASGVIYGPTSKFEKSKYFYRAFEDQASNLFTIRDRQQHSQDKSLISHAFSRANVIQHEESIYDKAGYLMDRIAQRAKDGQTIPLFPAFRCMTLDTISEFAFGRPAGALRLESFESAIFDAIDNATQSVPFVSVGSLPCEQREDFNMTSSNISPSYENHSDGLVTTISVLSQMDFWNWDRQPTQDSNRCIQVTLGPCLRT